jgi:RNA recognition motif. (a.k.a. RRM, RBD, or RNP domain)
VIVKVLGQGCVTDLRLSLDENMRPRGFGYVELKDESMVDRAIEELSGMEIGEIYRTICAVNLYERFFGICDLQCSTCESVALLYCIKSVVSYTPYSVYFTCLSVDS